MNKIPWLCKNCGKQNIEFRAICGNCGEEKSFFRWTIDEVWPALYLMVAAAAVILGTIIFIKLI